MWGIVLYKSYYYYVLSLQYVYACIVNSRKNIFSPFSGLGEPTYYAVANEATAHIQSLVAKQRSKKPKPLNRV